MTNKIKGNQMKNKYVVTVEMTMTSFWEVDAVNPLDAKEIIFNEEHPDYDHDVYQDGFSWNYHQLQPDMGTLEIEPVEKETK
jgi:hypothetical protein